MSLESIPVWILLLATIVAVIISIEAGFRMGRNAHRRSAEEKEAPISGIAGAILGLVAFMLAFTFGIVSDRYEARKALVRQEANAVRAAYRRADFLPEPGREVSRRLLREYVDIRLSFVEEGGVDGDRLHEVLSRTVEIQDGLWDLAAANAAVDMNSEIASLYIQTLDEIIETHASRVALSLQARIPLGIWAVLAGLTVLGMLAMGYHLGIAGSRRSAVTIVLAISFAMVIAVIASLDRPTGFIQVTQKPLVDVQRFIAGREAGR